METVAVTYRVNGNTLEILPASGSFQNNSTYSISIESLLALDGTELGPFEAKEMTAILPLYCHVFDVQALIGDLDIDEDEIVYFIRDASKYSDFITEARTMSTGTADYEIQQLVKYKAARDAVLRYYISHSGRSGSKGMVGEVSFEIAGSTPDLKNLLKALNEEVAKWEEKARGFIAEGRVAPVSVQRGSKGSALSTITSYVNGTDRGGVGGY